MVAVLAAGYLLCFPAAPKVRRMQKLQIETLTFRVWHGATDRSLNDGQIPHLHGVRVALGTGYHRVEGNRRASRNGLVSDLPPEIPTVTIRNLFRRCMHADGSPRPPAGALLHRRQEHRRGRAQAGARLPRGERHARARVRHDQTPLAAHARHPSARAGASPCLLPPHLSWRRYLTWTPTALHRL
jgi:hypothetical protein